MADLDGARVRLILELAHVGDGGTAEDGGEGEAEQGREGERGVEAGDVAREEGGGGRGQEAAESVGIRRVEGARPPDAVADVHEEAVEMVDVFAGVGRGIGDGGLGGGHGVFEGALVEGEDGAEAAERAEGGGEEEGVDQFGGGDDDAGCSACFGMGKERRDGLVESEDC